MNKYIVVDTENNIVSCGTAESGLDQRVSTEHTQVWVDFPDDIQNYRFINGEFVSIPAAEIADKEFVEASNIFKGIRNTLLEKSDWTQVPDAPVDRSAWAAYRQQLRDLPANTEDPANPVWPIPPS